MTMQGSPQTPDDKMKVDPHFVIMAQEQKINDLSHQVVMAEALIAQQNGLIQHLLTERQTMLQESGQEPEKTDDAGSEVV